MTRDKAAQLERLFATFGDDLVRRTRRHVRDHDTAEEAAAGAWVIAAAKPMPSCDDEAQAWLTTVARHEAFRLHRTTPEARLRDQGLAPRSLDYALMVDGRPGDSIAPITEPLEETAERRMRAHEALHAVAALRPNRRDPFAARVAGFSYAEIAEARGQTYTNTNRSITEARALVRGEA